jgi:hypothetical protein
VTHDQTYTILLAGLDCYRRGFDETAEERKSLLDAYARHLDDATPENLSEALLALVETSKALPALSEICGALAEIERAEAYAKKHHVHRLRPGERLPAGFVGHRPAGYTGPMPPGWKEPVPWGSPEAERIAAADRERIAGEGRAAVERLIAGVAQRRLMPGVPSITPKGDRRDPTPDA